MKAPGQPARTRRLSLWLALAAAGGLLVALAPPAPQAAAVVQNVPRPAAATEAARARPVVAAATGPVEVLRLRPRLALDVAAIDGALWALPPPPPPQPPQPPQSRVAPPAAVVAAPAPPAAPALPFRLLGRYADGGREGVVLQGPQGEVFLAHAGETLAGTYRVESLSGNLMVLHYLPLNLRQTMDVGIAR